MEKKPFEDGDFYVTDPTSTKDGVSSYTSYTVKGKKVIDKYKIQNNQEETNTTKKATKSSNIFIPELPHKKAMGKNDKEVVDFRIEQINRFCVKLSNIPYLFNSSETQMFLQNTSDVIKTMNNLQNESYEDMLNKYQEAFPDFDDVSNNII